MIMLKRKMKGNNDFFKGNLQETIIFKKEHEGTFSFLKQDERKLSFLKRNMKRNDQV